MSTKNVVENYFNAMKEGRLADMQKYVSPNQKYWISGDCFILSSRVPPGLFPNLSCCIYSKVAISNAPMMMNVVTTILLNIFKNFFFTFYHSDNYSLPTLTRSYFIT